MIAVHRLMIHGRCPVNGNWDYYHVEIESSEIIFAEKIEASANQVRGLFKTQEEIADMFAGMIPSHCKISITGNHGQNVQTTVIVQGKE